MVVNVPTEVSNLMHPLANREVTSRILEYLQINNFGYISEIARNTRVNIKTAKKHLLALIKAGMIEERRIGKARVFVYKSSAYLAVSNSLEN